MGHGPPSLVSFLSRGQLPVFPVGLVLYFPLSDGAQMLSDSAKAFCVCEFPGVTQGRQHSYMLTVLSWDLGVLGHPVTALSLLPG